MESTFNKTFTPLEAGRAYIGSYEKVDAYSSCVISLISDQDCLITAYQSQNKSSEYPITFSYTTPNTQFNMPMTLSLPYVYFTVRNQSANAQTYLNFTVIYKTAYTQAGAGANSNIFDSNGNNLLSDGNGNLGIYLNTVNPSLIQNNGLKTYLTNASIPITSAVQRVSGVLWNASSILSGATSSKLDCGSISSTNLSVYGTTTANGSVSVLFSSDNTNFYQSQYSFTIAVSGEFGFSCPSSAPYVQLLWTGSPTTITAIASAS